MIHQRRYRSFFRQGISILLASILVVMSLVGCSLAPQPGLQITPPTESAPTAVSSPEPSPAPTRLADPTPAQTVSTEANPSPTPALPGFHPRYTLNARFNYSTHLLEVSEAIRFTNPSLQPLGEALLIVESNRYAGVFSLQELRWASGEAVTAYTMEDHNLKIPYAIPLKPGEETGFDLKFTVALPALPEPSAAVRPAAFGYTDRQSNLVDWFAYVPPYQTGAGWISHPAWFYGEHQVFPAADFDVTLDMAVYGQELIVAASGLDTDPGPAYAYHLKNARTFAVSISPDYRVLEGDANGIKIYSYVFPFTLPAGEETLQNTIDAVKLYAELFGPYPYDSLSVVEADFLDGMEYDGLYFLSRGFYNLYDGTVMGYLTAIAVHETAHQWWYARVGNDQALEPWLDEALCTYSERLYYERYHPDQVNWWWSFRVIYYKPEGYVNGTLYDFEGFRPYVNAVYLRGAQFLDALRKQAGDEAFFKGLKDYSNDFAGKIATRQDFFSYFGEAIQTAAAGYFK